MKGTKLLVVSLFSTVFLSFTPVNKKYIVIDPGHGGNDMGVNLNGQSEKEITLTIAKEIKTIIDSQDRYEVVLTRDSDTNSQLKERTDLINKLTPEMVISLHVNGSPQKESTQQGQEIYFQNSDPSRILAERISQKFTSSKVIGERNLHILRESKSPTVLVELGFINNSKDRAYITSREGQREIVQKFVEVINESK
ncbi:MULTISPECIES: N-acetylmuramoyl-L-alanine amidase [unclassified Chryseobacterium]|uniref:N-acetylmuramoyl-L-alanine amidase family protein n=1 Tax=unclassified Chryseobacterium TaxID=2593645 RepID=UPI0012CA057A|nr:MULTISPECIES: N-acetylmuramoyl-L-alanine amidase [unclassified Chryseobacterium]MPS65284.1 N-acetylmuramoyl-L-alanine amidase [Chryseobacterium sp.]UMQ43875.1 N-acetylmuramoyl-L-alanine amidase [Chryseobacterium sp. Y16C]